VLGDEFGDSVNRLIQRIKRQKDIIIKSYGPLMLQDKRTEPALYGIPKELDPQGHEWVKALEQAQAKVPQTMLVKVRTIRQLKDKIGAGHYLVVVHVIDRIGGNRIVFNEQRTEQHYKTISKNLRAYQQKKKNYLNQENRQTEEKRKDGTMAYKRAEATGLNFFKKQNPDADIDNYEDIESQSGSGSLAFSSELNHNA
jgi:hypothetical protein